MKARSQSGEGLAMNQIEDLAEEKGLNGKAAPLEIML
jgi:hypothetical protein